MLIRGLAGVSKLNGKSFHFFLSAPARMHYKRPNAQHQEQNEQHRHDSVCVLIPL